MCTDQQDITAYCKPCGWQALHLMKPRQNYITATELFWSKLQIRWLGVNYWEFSELKQQSSSVDPIVWETYLIIDLTVFKRRLESWSLALLISVYFYIWISSLFQAKQESYALSFYKSDVNKWWNEPLVETLEYLS